MIYCCMGQNMDISKHCLKQFEKKPKRIVSSLKLNYNIDKGICIKPAKKARSHTNNWNHQKKKKTARDCKSFARVENYLRFFCPNLQNIPQPIYDLTRKGRPFIWTKMHQEAFEEIKTRLLKFPMLYVPDNKGRFQLFLDTSKKNRFIIIPNSKWYS